MDKICQIALNEYCAEYLKGINPIRLKLLYKNPYALKRQIKINFLTLLKSDNKNGHVQSVIALHACLTLLIDSLNLFKVANGISDTTSSYKLR